jgi:hypothetical protein
MAANQPTAPEVPNSRARTIKAILLLILVVMIVRDILARRRERLRTSSRRDISLVVR